MKKVVVFGATGLSGKQIVGHCLKAGHWVTAFIRQDTFPVQHPQLTVIKGHIFLDTDIGSALESQEVVVSCVGNMNFDDPTPIVTPFMKVVLPHLASSQRLILQTGSGLMLHDAKTLRRDLPDQPPQLRFPRVDHWEAFLQIAFLDINWLAVCAPRIVAGDCDDSYVCAEKYFPQNAQGQVKAGNIGAFVAGEIAKQEYRQTRVAIADRRRPN